MCGIYGYVGKDNAAETILSGLKRLEYRGYDSWGIAIVKDNKLMTYKKVGAIGDTSSIKELPTSNIGIGHTRWATHGSVTEINAHPHLATDLSFSLAQNGIVENYQEHKQVLIQKGYIFTSQTDTEIIVHLIEEKMKTANDLVEAVRQAFLDLKGRNTIIVLPKAGDKIIAIRHGSPLVIGIGENNEYIFASDTLSFADKTKDYIYVNDFEAVVYDVNTSKLEMFNVKTKATVEPKVLKMEHEDFSIGKDKYDHYMLKEVFEQRYTTREAVQYTNEDFAAFAEAIKKAHTVFTVGAGGAFLAADQVAYFLRTVSNIRALGVRSYDIESYLPLMNKGDVILAVSQSGETADTIEALNLVKARGVRIASVVNMLGSTITQMSEFQFLSRSGPEICVLSTKSSTAQTAFGFLLAMTLKDAQGNIELRENIDKYSDYLETYLTDTLVAKTKEVAQYLLKREHVFLLGKGQNNCVAQIGALNLKEASYIHAEAFTGGELKHGVISLVEKGTPVICFVDDGEDFHYMLNVTAEVKARGAYVIGLATKNNDLFDAFVELPTDSGIVGSAIGNVIPCQLITYNLAVLRGLNPDKPRNLAKSVTVK